LYRLAAFPEGENWDQPAKILDIIEPGLAPIAYFTTNRSQNCCRLGAIGHSSAEFVRSKHFLVDGALFSPYTA
jgi:hypothetical protein